MESVNGPIVVYTGKPSLVPRTVIEGWGLM